MAKSMDEREVRKYLAAFADGELDVEQNLRVLEHLSMHPQATRRAMHQQQLRQAVSRTMCEQSPAAPDSLRAAVEAMSRQSADAWQGPAAPADARRSVLAKLGRWLPVMAATILLAASIVLLILSQRPQTPTGFVYSDSRIGTAAIKHMQQRHLTCSQRVSALIRAEQFGTQVAELPQKVSRYLGAGAVPAVLDLAGVGYQFKGAGECSAPGARAVHLVYQADPSTGRNDSLSLWVRRDADGQVPIDAGKLYSATNRNAEHPILLWRQGETVFYLVGDATSRIEAAARRLASGK